MSKARDLLGKSGTGGFVQSPQTKKLDLTVPETDGSDKKQDTRLHKEDKSAHGKSGTKVAGGPPTSVRPKV